MRSAAALPLLLALALLVSGCGSSTKSAATTAVPPAKTQREWITRLVDRYLRPMNRNLTVVNALGTPQGKLLIQTRNETSIRTVNKRMTDLGHCSDRLARVGPPPETDAPLDRVYDNFSRSCPFYERIADAVLKAVPLIASGDAAKAAQGEREFAKANAPSKDAARYYAAAVEILQQNNLLAQYQGP